MKNLLKISIFIVLLIKLITSYPTTPDSSNYNDDDDDDDNSYIVDKKIVDLNNPDQIDMQHMNGLNVNVTAIRLQKEQLERKYGVQSDQVPMNLESHVRRSSGNENQENAPEKITPAQQREYIARENIRQIIQSSIIRNNGNLNSPRRQPDDIHHQTAVYPQCVLPKNMNATAFFNDDLTWNLFFLPPVSDNPLTAVLRLYKIQLDETTTPNQNESDCSQPEELIRITVSYYVKQNKRREKRKRLTSSVMIARNYTGWIELDVKAAIKHWNRSTNNQSKKNYGIAIDVQDQDETYLRAANFFYGYTCEANKSPAIPWNIYLEKRTNSFVGPVPKSPRIDFEIHQRNPHTLASISPNGNIFSSYFGYGYRMNNGNTLSLPDDFDDFESESHEDREQPIHEYNNQNTNNNARRQRNHNHRRHNNHHQNRLTTQSYHNLRFHRTPDTTT